MGGKEPRSDRSLDILRIARAVYPESMGGGAIHVHSMSKRQAKMGHNVTILTTDRGDRTLPGREKRDGYEIIRDKELATLLGNSITPGFIRSFANLKSEYDVIHVHSHLSLSSNIATLLSRFGDTPLVVTNHGLRSQTAPDWVQDIYLPTVGKFTFNSSDTVLTYSETERDELRELGINAPIRVIHNGVDCTRFSPDNSETDSNQLLFVGRLRSTKGPDIALEIFRQLHGDFPELKLKVVGEGPLREDLEATVAEYDLNNTVDFVGELPNEEMPEVYNDSSIFILPTEREGVPRTLLESMACGVPVVTTNLPQVEPVVDGGGLLIERDVDEFAGVIRKLLTSPDTRKSMGAQGRDRVRENYSWQETVSETTEIYQELLNNKHQINK